jgi:hypothetical protein
MANISLLEFNHNEPPPRSKEEFAAWAKLFWLYVSSGDKSVLPRGFERCQMRHHSAPDPLSKSTDGGPHD